MTERSEAITMASDYDDNRVIAKRKSNDDVEKMTSSVSLSVVTGSGLTASTSSIAPLVGATMGVKTQSPRSPDRTRAAKSNERGLDFIGTTNAVKKLFSISLDALSTQDPSIQQNNNRKANKKPTLLAVHNFDGTLIIDDAEDESNYEFFQSNDNNDNDNVDKNDHYYYSDSFNSNHYNRDDRVSDTTQSTATLLPPSSQSLALEPSPSTLAGNHIDQLSSDAISMISNIVQSTAVTTNADKTALSENEHMEGRKDSSRPSSAFLSPPKAPREYVEWKFQDLNMILGHDTLVVRPPKDSSTTATAPEGSAGGGIAVRVEDVRFLRSLWETFQRQQTQQQHQRLLGSTNNQFRSYAQALLQERENDLSVSSGSKDLSNTTSAVVATINTTTTNDNDPQQDVPNSDSSDENRSKRDFIEVPLQTCIVPFSGPLGGKIPPFDSSPSTLSSDPNRVSSDAISSTGSISPRSDNSCALSIVLDAYLDNLMTNVPQLALCLEEKGLIQSIKMLPTEEIPSMMLHPSTLETSRPLDSVSVGDGHPTDGGRSAAQHVHRHNRRLSSSSKLEETIFSPQMMETNASALLRFLKTNCTRDNATYLLRHDSLNEAALDDGTGNPPQNIRLYDISSISAQKQKKWIWWLATMSYRFALRLRHLETSTEASFSGSEGMLTESQKRAIRDRQRSLFQQTLDLLQDLMDIDGNAHESMVASVSEHMADTYLSSVVSGSGNGTGELAETISSGVGAEAKSSSPRKQSFSEISPSPSPTVVTATISARISADPSSLLSHLSSVMPTNSPQLPNSENAPTDPFSDSSKFSERQRRHPYAAVPVDALNKAQDHLVRGIKALSTLFERDVKERRLHIETKMRQEEAASKRSRRRQRKQRRFRDDVGSTREDRKGEDDGRIPRLSPAMVLQLFGMNFKLVNTSLRLAEHHLGNYSSSAMQALRTAARRLNDAANLLDYHKAGTQETETEKDVQSEEDEKRTESLQLQYISLLEHCGHFARSFASDELWRDRGHASGEDVISVLSDVEAFFVESRKIIGENDDDEIEKSESRFWKMMRMDVLLKRSKGKISLHSLSGIIAPLKMNASQTEKAIKAAKAVLAEEKVLKRERRKVLVASCVSYSRAIMAFQFTVKISDQTDQAPDKMVLLNLLRQRLGDACNETGKVLLAALRTLLVNNQGSKKNNESQLAAEALLDSAEFWFTQGLEAFEACKDTRNLALLRCNLCQSFKLRANSGFSKRDSSSSSKHAENCLQQAADQLMTAHEDLGQRDTDPQTWDMVSEELAATFLVLGVRRRQSLLGSGNAPVIFQVMRLSPGEERSIVDPMERALKIYEQSDNAHQAAAAHYQLALTFSKLWTCQLNESNTRKKLSKAFEHYSSTFNYFSTHSRGNEPTFCLLCLDLASLYAAIPGEEGLLKSLGCCLDCCDTFSMEAIKVSTTNLTVSTSKLKADWYDKMETIAKSVDDRVFKLLRSLVKVDPTRYKDMYREGLTAKMVRNVPDESEELDWNPKSSTLLALHEVLLAIKKMYGVIVSKS